MGARHSGRIAAAACAIVVAIIIGCRIAVYFTGSMTGGYLQYKAYVDSGTVILKTGDTARTWHVEGEWEQSYGGRKPEEFTTPRTLIVIPDESDKINIANAASQSDSGCMTIIRRCPQSCSIFDDRSIQNPTLCAKQAI